MELKFSASLSSTGEDVNVDNIGKIAEFGRGTAAFATDPETLGDAMAELFESVSDPLAWDLELASGESRAIQLDTTLSWPEGMVLR